MSNFEFENSKRLEEPELDEAAEAAEAAETAKETTLLDEANAMRAAQANMDVKEIRLARAAAEEDRMRKDADRVQTNALMSSAEVTGNISNLDDLSGEKLFPVHKHQNTIVMQFITIP